MLWWWSVDCSEKGSDNGFEYALGIDTLPEAMQYSRSQMHESLGGKWKHWMREWHEQWEFWHFCPFLLLARESSAGRIHQMRANKSHLKAQTDWSKKDLDPACYRCRLEAEIKKANWWLPHRSGRKPESTVSAGVWHSSWLWAIEKQRMEGDLLKNFPLMWFKIWLIF